MHVSLRPILLVNGILLSVMSVVMLLPMAVDLINENPDWVVFLSSSFITAFIGVILYLSNRGYKGSLNLRQAFLFTTTSYFTVSVFAAIPLYLSSSNIDFTDAWFEATSGITSTGASVLSGLDLMPPGVLLWRSLLNAMGGIGIVVLALAVLPMLRIGGMQLFRTESSDKMEKILPRTTQIALVITLVFLLLVFVCAFGYGVAGMSSFDAINHALTTVATGGFSTHDKSIAYFNSPQIEMLAVVFMILGALPMILYFQVLKGNPQALFQNTQVQWFLGIVASVTVLIVIWLVYTDVYDFWSAVRYALFSVVSIITTTGYASTDYAAWGTFSTSLLFMLIVVGGCTGSTSGGIKIFRYQVLYKTAKAQIRQLIQPHGVFVPQYNQKPITENVSQSVLSFFILFAFVFMVVSISLSAFGMDFLTAMSSAAQALANVGPGLGEIVGPAGNYASLEDGAKWILSVAMIMGRLELFTVLVLFTPYFWRA
ncbi:MAG: potassium transporter TrkH [Rickettsiales bacterium]|nr:potassium transporter TrkH [Rickettsiales bacterium]